MSDINNNNDLFFLDSDLDSSKASKLVDKSLLGFDDGELFLEYNESESISFDDGIVKNSNYNIAKGFGLRSVLGDRTAYAHSNDITERALEKAADTVKSVKKGYSGEVNLSENPKNTNKFLYTNNNPTKDLPYNDKVKLMGDIDLYLRKKDPSVKQVSVSLTGNWQNIQIIRSGGMQKTDIRPLTRLNISVVVEKNGRMESGSYGTGGRMVYSSFINEESWQKHADEALRQALVQLESSPAPAGKMPVVLGGGWPGILLHEAIGHGLEGDFNRKKTSAFSGLIGQRVAAKGVTVVDDGTINDRRGSITIDDEGTPSENTVLIEDGILKGYMHDRMSARLMGLKATGNGRRESFAHQPMPRMTNTYMLAGDKDPSEIIASVEKGLYAVNFGGGQVDITSGKFVFSASEAYMIENGKVTRPVKGATLIGNGPDVLTKVSMVGNDMQMDPGIGTCGKAGQGVPVGVGQPTLKVDELTVGGTEV